LNKEKSYFIGNMLFWNDGFAIPHAGNNGCMAVPLLQHIYSPQEILMPVGWESARHIHSPPSVKEQATCIYQNTTIPFNNRYNSGKIDN
jgi:hypothetical protein